MDIITYGLLNKKIKKKADLDSPHFTGEPTAPTPDYPDNSEKIATTEYVNEAVAGAGGGITLRRLRELVVESPINFPARVKYFV